MLFDLGFLLLLTAGQALAFSKTDYNYVREVSPTLKIHWKEVSGDDMYLALETKQTKGLLLLLLLLLLFYNDCPVKLPYAQTLASQTTQQTKNTIDGLHSA